jgi:hypothetical protein
MASYYLAPVVHKTWFVPGGNTPASGGLLFTYVAGSSTKSTVYKDNAGNSAHTNPIVLDSGGNLPSGSEVWIPTGVTLDIVFAPSNDTDPPASPYDTLEDISGINDVNAASSDWVTGPTPTFVSGTQFVLQGDQSATFKNGRRIRTTNTAGTIYGRITSVAAAAGSTTVNTVSDSGSLDSGLSATAYGLVDPQYSSINEYTVNRDGGSVASAGNGTTNIWGVTGDSVHITGTNTIACFSSAAYAGAKRTVIFDGALSLQSSAAFLSTPRLSGTITTEAGDRAEVLASTTAHSVITQYQRASGKPLIAGTASTGIVISGETIGTNISTMANALGANVALSSTVNYFAGPTVAQGTNGTWLFTGMVTMTNTSAAARFTARLTDGTTVIASGEATSAGGNEPITIGLSGVLASPAGSVAIQVRDNTSTTGVILSNSSGNNKDSTLTAVRIL